MDKLHSYVRPPPQLVPRLTWTDDMPPVLYRTRVNHFFEISIELVSLCCEHNPYGSRRRVSRLRNRYTLAPGEALILWISWSERLSGVRTSLNNSNIKNLFRLANTSGPLRLQHDDNYICIISMVISFTLRKCTRQPYMSTSSGLGSVELEVADSILRLHEYVMSTDAEDPSAMELWGKCIVTRLSGDYLGRDGVVWRMTLMESAKVYRRSHNPAITVNLRSITLHSALLRMP